MYRMLKIPLVLASLLMALMTLVASPALARHIAAHQCGVQSSSFARICRPSAHTSCLGAVKRGVPGFTIRLCERRKSACSRCLADIQKCISRIGHWPRVTHSCEKCKERFDRCMKWRYPQKP